MEPGTILNERYRIESVLGRGGFGITYKGYDLKLNMPVAIKEYAISGWEEPELIEKGKQKFLTEARALAQFHENPGVVDVRDFFEANKTAYIVMEYLDGKDLRETLKETCFTADEIFSMMRPVMDVLEKMHAAGILHRDISPDNIMLLKNGSVKLMDFGAARVAELADERSVSVVLKGGYAPEEQYRPKGNQGPWTDIYALCATIYKCITGITPDDALERSHKDRLEWPSELGVEISLLQEDVLKKGMAVFAEDRFQTIGEMREMLERVPKICRENEEQKKKKKTPETGIYRSWFVGICAAAAVAVGSAVFFFHGKNAAEVPTAAEETADHTAEEAQTIGESIHVILGVGNDISVKGFHQAVETLKERLAIFCGDADYKLEVVEDKVDLYLPKECLGDFDIYYILRAYLTRATKLYAYREDGGYNPEKFELKREDLEEVVRMDGEHAGVKLVLTQECAEKYQNEIKEWGEDLRFAQDMSVDLYYYYTTIAEGDGKTFYLVHEDLEGVLGDLVCYNLTHEPLEENFSFWIDLSYKADWESADGNDQTGEFQRDVQEITGDTITLYLHTLSENLSAGERLDTETILKKRLDILGQPYAFGWKEDSEAAIKTKTEHMGLPIIQALGNTYGVTIRSGFVQENIYPSGKCEISYKKNDDGTYQVLLPTQETLPENEVILLIDDYPYLSGHMESAEEGNVLIFDQTYFPKTGAITEENLWVAAFVEQILCGEELPQSMYVDQDDYFLFSDDPNHMEEVGYGVGYDNLLAEYQEKLQQKITQEAKAWISQENHLCVQYNLEVNETLPEEVLRLGKETYEALEFQDSIFEELRIYFVDENDERKERLRIVFNKVFNPGYIYVHGIFANGRLERYKEMFYEQKENDPFYQELEEAYPYDKKELWK